MWVATGNANDHERRNCRFRIHNGKTNENNNTADSRPTNQKIQNGGPTLFVDDQSADISGSHSKMPAKVLGDKGGGRNGNEIPSNQIVLQHIERQTSGRSKAGLETFEHRVCEDR